MAGFTGTVSRRQALGLMGALLGSAAIPLPQAARAQGTGAISPPRLRSAMGNPDQLDDYLVKLAEFVAGFGDRYPNQELGPLTGDLAEFYVLDCKTRDDIPLDMGGEMRTYVAPAYVDGFASAAIAELPPRPTVGPTMEFRRGTVTGVLLQNEIEVCGDARDNPQYTDDNPASGHTPHGFQVTNLHTHGLHVSPNAPSDDVLVTVDSAAALAGGGHAAHKALRGAIYAGDGSYFPHWYTMRPDHPVGTFWYHPHKHGSVASQVAPGMAGALIVRESGAGDADFDTLLARHGITEAEEEIIVIQTLKGQPATGPDGDAGMAVFFPEAYYDTFRKPASAGCFGLDLGPKALDIPVTVNGLTNPAITMEPGQIKRLRIVNAASGATFVPDFGLDDLEVYAIAVDGIALQPAAGDQGALDQPYYRIARRIDPVAEPARYWTTAEIMTLAPGQRLDLLVKVADDAQPKTLQIADANVPPNQTPAQRSGDYPPNVIETSSSQPGDLWRIEIGTSSGALPAQSLPTKREFREAPISRPPSPLSVPAGTPAKTQELTFRSEKLDPEKPAGDGNPTFTINGVNFDPDLDNPPQIQLGLNEVTNWYVKSTNDAHIFHIHINSFQALARVKPTEPPVSFTYEMPIWRDTIYFDGTSEFDTTILEFASYQVDYTGEYVLHCHNLFHEDSGMMLTVAVTAGS